MYVYGLGGETGRAVPRHVRCKPGEASRETLSHVCGRTAPNMGFHASAIGSVAFGRS
jgi:hypothetical protein